MARLGCLDNQVAPTKDVASFALTEEEAREDSPLTSLHSPIRANGLKVNASSVVEADCNFVSEKISFPFGRQAGTLDEVEY